MLVYDEEQDQEYFSFRPLKAGLVSNLNYMYETYSSDGKFPSPESGVSFKHKITWDEWSPSLQFPSPESGVSFKRDADEKEEYYMERFRPLKAGLVSNL